MSRSQSNAFLFGWSLLVLSGVIFGASFSLFKIAAESGQSPISLAFWYVTLSAALLAPFVFWKHWGHMRIGRSAFWFCFVWGTLSTTIPALLFFVAARELPAGIIAMAISFVPIATFAGAILLGHDEPSFVRCVGLGFGAAAALMVTIPETSLPEGSDAGWLVLPLGVVICYAAEHLFFALRVPPDARPETLLLLMFVFGAGTLLPLTLATGTLHAPFMSARMPDLALLGAAIVTVLDYFLFMALVIRFGPVFTSQAAYVVTIAGVGWGVLLLGETHSIWVWTAILVAVAGAMMVQPRVYSDKRS